MRLRLLMCIILLAGCHSTPATSYYALSPSPETLPGAESMALTSVTIPGLLDRPQIILLSGQNTIRILEYRRWAEPMDSMIKRILSENLHAQTSENAKCRIAVTIDEFDANDAGEVTLKASWTVQPLKGKIQHYRFEKSEAASSDDIASIVNTMSRLLGELAEKMMVDKAWSYPPP